MRTVSKLDKIGDELAFIVYLVISSNYLAISKKRHPTSKEDLSVLLDGNDTKGLLLECNIKSSNRLIDLCYNAREAKKTITIVMGIQQKEIQFS